MTEIVIPPNGRGFIAGMTGSGKTYLAKKIVAKTERLVVFDCKDNLSNDLELEPESRSAWRRFRMGKPVRLAIKEPVLYSEEIVAYYDEMFMKVFYSASCTVYIDELTSCTNGAQSYPRYLRALYMRGREPIMKKGRVTRGGISMLGCTQRTANIPSFCMTESDYAFIFRLQKKEDRDTAASYYGEELNDPIPDEHGFYYKNLRMENPEYHVSLS